MIGSLTSMGTTVRYALDGEASTVGRTLREVWQWLPTEVIGFDIGLFTDAVVTVLAFGSPHRTVNLFVELVKETETIRGFTPTTVNSDVEVLVRNAIDGWRPSVADVNVACEHDLDTAIRPWRKQPPKRRSNESP